MGGPPGSSAAELPLADHRPQDELDGEHMWPCCVMPNALGGFRALYGVLVFQGSGLSGLGLPALPILPFDLQAFERPMRLNSIAVPEGPVGGVLPCLFEFCCSTLRRTQGIWMFFHPLLLASLAFQPNLSVAMARKRESREQSGQTYGGSVESGGLAAQDGLD